MAICPPESFVKGTLVLGQRGEGGSCELHFELRK
jgi:hypothetical protein